MVKFSDRLKMMDLPELVAERNELREIIKEAISKLSDEHKEVIVLEIFKVLVMMT